MCKRIIKQRKETVKFGINIKSNKSTRLFNNKNILKAMLKLIILRKGLMMKDKATAIQTKTTITNKHR